jgi:hypothetical protein
MGAQIPAKFQLDPLGDHLNTCTTHSGGKKAHDWMVDQLPDLFHTTPKVKTQQVVKSRGQDCGDIELTGCLVNVTGPVSLVLDLRIVHDRVGSSTDPTLNGHLKYPNNLEQSLNNNRPESVVSFRSVIPRIILFIFRLRTLLSIPSHHRVTQQTLSHWYPFLDLKLMFTNAIYQWPVPLPSRDFRSTPQKQGWPGSR